MTRWLVLGALSACTLASPASDYFDEQGIETVAIVERPQELAHGGAGLFVSDGARVLAMGSGAVEIGRATTGSGVRGLVARGDLVAWCDGADRASFALSGPGRALPAPGPCDGVAVGRDAVIQLSAGLDASTVRRFVVSTQTMEADRVLPGAGANAAIAATDEGVIVAATGAGVLRECLPGDAGCEGGWCRLSAVDREVGSRGLLLARSPAGVRPLLVTALQGVLFASTTECCSFDAAECAFDAVRSQRGVSLAESVAERDGVLYALRPGRVTRVWSFADPSKDEPVAPASESARLLAIGPAHAYFADGSKIQRTPLGAR